MKIEYFASPEIKPLAQHSGELGWYSEADWECFLRTGVVFGHRLQSGEIVSSAYLSNFENQIGWLGAVIVKSRFQGKKLGKDLIQKALTIIPEHDFVLGVIATERGKRMYEQAGFIEVGNTQKLTANLPARTYENVAVRNFESKDLNAVLKLDRQAVGYDRAKLLKERIQLATAKIVFVNDQNELIGYMISSQDGQRISLGPIVASSLEVAEALLLQAVSVGGSFRIDLPHWQNAFSKVLLNQSFELERICPLLTFRGRSLMRTSDSYFAIMAQALG